MTRFSALTNHEILPPEEQLDLLRRCKEGCEASRDRLVRHNQRLVVKNVRIFVSNQRDRRFEDLIIAGNHGLLIAIEKFDLTKENLFSTYAVWWIKAKIREELQAHSQRVVRYKKLHDEFTKAQNQLRKEHRYEPFEHEVFERLGWDEKTQDKYHSTKDSRIVSIDQIDETTLYAQKNAPIQEQSAADSVLNHLIREEVVEDLDSALSQLDQDIREIICRHHGYGYHRSETYDELAIRLDMTREQVRRKENEGIRILYHELVDTDDID